MSARGFGSDNHSGVLPEVMAALVQANVGHAPSYGTDDYSVRAAQLFRDNFGPQSQAFFVFNGTAANVLALTAVTRSHHSVLCASSSHLHNDECGAPEFVGGRKLIAIDGKHGKLTVADIAPHRIRQGDQHYSQAKVLSITQPTECGTLYSINELRALCTWAHSLGLWVHLDGARLVVAAAALGCSLAALTTDVGVDVLSFGGTKNGLMMGEAVVFLTPGLADDFKFLRKQCMQLPSKTRFIAAQFCALLENELWRGYATAANTMANALAKVLSQHENIELTHPCEANAVFARVPKSFIKPLRQASFFYIWDEHTFEARLMTSFDTQMAEIEGFAAVLQGLSLA